MRKFMPNPRNNFSKKGSVFSAGFGAFSALVIFSCVSCTKKTAEKRVASEISPPSPEIIKLLVPQNEELPEEMIPFSKEIPMMGEAEEWVPLESEKP